MRSILHALLFAASLLAVSPLHADEQNSEVIAVGSDKFLRWYGHDERIYFIQISDPNDHLRKWTWAPIIETGNDEDISYEVDGTAQNGFFRLWFTDERTTDPDGDDFDGDYLSNIDEVTLYQTNPLNDDSDGDGIWDDYEVFGYYGYTTNPNSSDTDDDGLPDLDEIELYFSDPTTTDIDTDGDGLLDPVEVWLGLNPASTDSNNNGITDSLEDADRDLLTNIAEFSVHLTNAKRFDTDFDTLNDGWEVANGFNPRVSNLNDSDTSNDPGADPDNDGLTNSEEETIGTKAKNSDSDGDGIDDKTERDQGSNPNDPNDSAPPPTGTTSVHVTFGDDSGSHSEKYRVQLTPLEGDSTGHTERFRTNRDYGVSQTDTFQLPKGAKYRVELLHIDTNESDGVPDYDHTLEIDTSQGCLVVDDPESIMGTSPQSGGTVFVIEGKSATLHVPLFQWVTPKESPVTMPNDTAGDGQNEFTYSAAAPGVLTINTKILVKPTGTAGLTGHDGVKFSDRCIYTLPTIAGSTFAWDAANPGGKSTASGEHVTAKATYTTLPALNSEFGLKQAEFKCDSDSTLLPKADFEVFFSKDEKNHPGAGAGTTPNWFFYWQQFIPLGRIATLNFGGNGYGSTNPVTRVTDVGQLSSELNDETGHRGLHTFYETVAHESHHIVLWEGWWGQGGLPTAAQDTDGDTYPDTFEGNQAGYGFSVGQNDDYANGVPSTAQNPRWPNESAGYNYEEDICRQIEHSLNESQFDNQDWSHDQTNTNQGKNHK
jgi:hypothetical protein